MTAYRDLLRVRLTRLLRCADALRLYPLDGFVSVDGSPWTVVTWQACVSACIEATTLELVRLDAGAVRE